LGRKCRHDEHNLTRPTQQPLPVGPPPPRKSKAKKWPKATIQMANGSGHSGPGRRAAKNHIFPQLLTA